MNIEPKRALDCDAFERRLNDYMDGALDGDTLALFLAHARDCDACQRKLRAAEAVINGLRGLDDGVVIPMRAQAAWRRAVRAEITGRKRRRFSRLAAGIAAAFIVMFGSTFALREMGLVRRAQTQSADESPTDALSYAQAGTPTVVYASTVSGAGTATAKNRITNMSGILLQSDGEASDALPQTTDPTSNTASASKFTTAKLTRRATRTAQTELFDQERETLRELVDEYEGYFALDSVDSSSALRAAGYTIRVPDQQMDDFLLALDNVGKTLSLERASEDVSAYYYDAQSRLDSQKLIVERLNALIPDADGDTLASLNAQLSAAYDEIDSLERLLRAYDTDEDYATVILSLREVGAKPVPTAEPTLSQRSSSGFGQSLSAMGDFFEDMVVSMAIIAPVAGSILLAVAIILTTVYIVKRKKKKDAGPDGPEEG